MERKHTYLSIHSKESLVAISFEESMMKRKIEELRTVAERLSNEHEEAYGVLNDILGYIEGDILDISDIIEQKLISLSLRESEQEHLERMKNYYQMKYNSQK